MIGGLERLARALPVPAQPTELCHGMPAINGVWKNNGDIERQSLPLITRPNGGETIHTAPANYASAETVIYLAMTHAERLTRIRSLECRCLLDFGFLHSSQQLDDLNEP